MKKYQVFLYEDRNESNGNYIGRTRRYDVEAEDDDQATRKAYRENPWARGCWCTELGATNTYGIEFKCECYGNFIKTVDYIFIEAKSREQAVRYYNNKIKGKRYGLYLPETEDGFKEDGILGCGPIKDVYVAGCYSDYDATNY